MPSSLQLAQPATVLPWSLCSSFQANYYWPVVTSELYPDGRVQQLVQAAQPRHSWSLSKKLAYTDWATLKAFYEARKGGLEPFYFYPERLHYDATGVSTTGRYTVRFNGQLQMQYNFSRFLISLQLMEIA